MAAGGHSHRVHQGQGVHVTLGGHTLDDLHQRVEVGAGRVDGKEDGVQAQLVGQAGGIDEVDRLFQRPAVGVLDDVVAGRDLDDDAGYAAVGRQPDVVDDAAAEGKDLGPKVALDDLTDGLLILLGDSGHPGFDAVHASLGQGLGDADLVVATQRESGLLLAVAQGHVVNLDLGGRS